MNLRLHLGNPVNQFSSYQVLPTKERYQVLVLPEINTISHATVGTQGAKLTIDGKGFGNQVSNIEVSVGGLACDVKDVVNEKIDCELAAGAVTADEYSGSGVHFALYDNSDNYGGMTHFRDTLKGDIDFLRNDGRLIEEGILHSLEYNWDSSVSQR